ncbi:ubiquinone biosynthesis hydroxylase [Polycladidibacter hongkongensis]|uniref:ubiquinone biosynthesis hydroxylase n=1 Tax=Polycladidibacter hongkongensis TaxID=1647556 RepID=UPI00082FD3E4|nr:ubiquinone biosynthesis hydroxylase [Pseudovibrio hongkongensis]
MSKDNHTTASQFFDVVIGGGGYVGLSLALALKQSEPDMKVALVDLRPRDAIKNDPRSSAIAAGACRMLDQLGIWHLLEGDAQPITEMIVTDSKLNDSVRPIFLTFSGEVKDGEPFAHMVQNNHMVGALYDACEAADVQIFAPDTLADFTTHPERTDITLASGKNLTARLLVAADGVRSKLRDLAGIHCNRWRYNQSGIVTTVAHESPHHGRAEEHFLPSGPFAILPLKGNRSSIVWTEKTSDADRLVKTDDFTFEIELERRFGKHLGPLSLDGPRHAFPLNLTLARAFIKPRFALAGDSAHGIHPIAGQGLNYGFKDVAALAEVLVDAHRLGLDIGAEHILERYQSWRRFDTWQMGVTTDVLNRLFSNDIDPVRFARDFGLGVVERLPFLKKALIGEAAATKGDSPKLLLGNPI